MDAYIGLIFPFAGVFAPMGTAQCWGQEVPVNQNQALYSLISNIYGGTGNPNIKLPDLRGRVLVGSGVSPYLNTTLNPAASGGTAATTLNATNLPLHIHGATFTPGGGSSSTSTISATVTIPVSTASGSANAPSGMTTYLAGVGFDDAGSGATLNGPYTGTAPTSGPSLTGTATGNVTLSGGSGGTVTVAPGGGTATPLPITNLQPYLAVTFYIVTQGLYPTRD
ncbi:phage tail protein [Azospirillum doebereinerae]